MVNFALWCYLWYVFTDYKHETETIAVFIIMT